MYICIYVYMYICLYVYMSLCLYAYMYICCVWFSLLPTCVHSYNSIHHHMKSAYRRPYVSRRAGEHCGNHRCFLTPAILHTKLHACTKLSEDETACTQLCRHRVREGLKPPAGRRRTKLQETTHLPSSRVARS